MLKTSITTTERALYEKEIKALKAQLADANRQLEIAEKYKNDYKKLQEEYAEKIKDVDKLKEEANLLCMELAKALDSYENNGRTVI